MANDGATPGNPLGIKDPEAFAHNLARMIEEVGKAASAYMKPREEGKTSMEVDGFVRGRGQDAHQGR